MVNPVSGPAADSKARCGGLDHAASHRPPAVYAAIACALTVTLLAGCYQRSVLPQSEGHITTPAAKPALDDVPPPARVSSFVPAPKPVVKPPTYSVVVNEVPVKELLLALARDTRQNIDIHPALEGLVSLSAINETLPAILERLSKQVSMRYRQTGNTLEITPDTPYSKTYQINYVNMIRNSSSITSVARVGGGTGTAASNTSVTTTSASDFWKILETDLRGILKSSGIQSAQAKKDRVELVRLFQETRLQETRAAAPAGPGAAAPPATGGAAASPAAAAPASLPVIEDVLINPVTGTITVSATESQHVLVQTYLDKVQATAQRQVLIEATIVEVTLSDQYQAGVDWSRLAVSGGITFTQSLLAGNIGGPPNFAIGYANPNSPIGNIAAAIRLLQQFGNTRVLSSPKLMAMNNQTALLKVTDDIVYFSLSVTPATISSTGAIISPATFTTKDNTQEVGVSMSLTPQINENGQVMLGVRPSITRLLSFVNDPNPSLAAAGVISPFPQLQRREMESVLQLSSGQTAILGGLMQDNTQYNRNAVPGIGNPANTGKLSEAFGYRDDQITKSELVIFLRPTVVTNASLDSDELKFYQRFLPRQTETPTMTVPGEKVEMKQ